MTLPAAETFVADTPFSRWDTRWKWVACTLAVLGISFLQTPHVTSVAVLFSILCTYLAGVPRSATLNRIGLLSLSFIPLLIVIPWAADDTWLGLRLATTMALRGFAIGLIAFTLARTATMQQNLAALAALGLPKTFVSILQLMFRYVAVLGGEWRRIRIAMRTRGFVPQFRWHSYKSLGHAVGAIIVRGAERGERVSLAMQARGYDGHGLLTHAQFHTKPTDAIYLLGMVATTIVMLTWDRSGFLLY